MPWSGGTFTRTNGVHTGSTLWVQDRDAGTKILAARHDTHDQDLADGINATLEKSGSNAATGNLDIGSNRITLVADGTAKTDAATVNQIQSNGAAFQATDSGSADAYAIALSPAVTAYAAGQTFTFKAANASTGASTLDVNTLGVKTLKKLNDQDIAAGDIESGSIVTVVYDGTNFQVTSQLATTAATSPGGSDTQVQYNSSSAFAGSANFTFDGTSATVGGPFILPDGAVGAPALTNTGDLDTGIYFPAGNQLAIATQGVQRELFDADGHITRPTQSAFLVRPTTDQDDIASGGDVTIVWGTEIFDQNSDFASNTFTAPVTGKYLLAVTIRLQNIDTASTFYRISLITSNRTYDQIMDPGGLSTDPAFWNFSMSVVADMDAADTVTVAINQYTGTAQTDIETLSSFSGYLLG